MYILTTNYERINYFYDSVMNDFDSLTNNGSTEKWKGLAMVINYKIKSRDDK